MKKLLLLAVLMALVVLTQGCLPNTRKGWSQDIINHETMNIQKINPVIFKVNQRILPERLHQLEETMGWQERMQALRDAKKESE
jgi:predicted small secreted protein